MIQEKGGQLPSFFAINIISSNDKNQEKPLGWKIRKPAGAEPESRRDR